MDKISVKSNLFIEIQDIKAKSDLTVIPFEISFEFLAKWKRGIGSSHGPT